VVATQPIEDLTDAEFDPYAEDDSKYGDDLDPYARLRELRAQGDVIPLGMDDATMRFRHPERYQHAFLAVSHEAVAEVLNDANVFSNSPFMAGLGVTFGQTLSVMDPPVHSQYRKILQRAFRPTVVTAWGNGIVGPVIDDLAAAFETRGRAELVEEFCRPYPFNVIYRMLALPTDDIATFYKLTMALIAFDRMDVAVEASEKLGRYFARLLDARRADPGDDVVSVIATAEVDGEYLPDEVAISFLRQLINAGGDTTFRTTTALLTGLLINPDQLAAVREDRSLVERAVEEALRWEGPVIGTARASTVDTVVCGVEIPADSIVGVSYGSANRDPAVFDHPESYDLFRDRHRHFGFAFGAHNCLGQMLARLEMTRALNAILDRLPNVRLDPEQPMPQMMGRSMRTPRQLHVVFDV
jgi:cytochrome P450